MSVAIEDNVISLGLVPSYENNNFRLKINVMKNDKNENKALSQTSVSGSVVDIVAFQNIKTGSIDWRGNHDLSTIYSNEYYLAKPNLWKPIYKKTI